MRIRLGDFDLNFYSKKMPFWVVLLQLSPFSFFHLFFYYFFYYKNHSVHCTLYYLKSLLIENILTIVRLIDHLIFNILPYTNKKTDNTLYQINTNSIFLLQLFLYLFSLITIPGDSPSPVVDGSGWIINASSTGVLIYYHLFNLQCYAKESNLSI